MQQTHQKGGGKRADEYVIVAGRDGGIATSSHKTFADDIGAPMTQKHKWLFVFAGFVTCLAVASLMVGTFFFVRTGIRAHPSGQPTMSAPPPNPWRTLVKCGQVEDVLIHRLGAGSAAFWAAVRIGHSEYVAIYMGEEVAGVDNRHVVDLKRGELIWVIGAPGGVARMVPNYSGLPGGLCSPPPPQ